MRHIYSNFNDIVMAVIRISNAFLTLSRQLNNIQRPGPLVPVNHNTANENEVFPQKTGTINGRYHTRSYAHAYECAYRYQLTNSG